MAALSAQQAVAAGLNLAYAAAAGGGDTMPCDGHTALHVVNGDVASKTVTIASQSIARPGLAAADIVVAVPAGQSRLIFPDPIGFANEDGRAEITYSAVTTVTVAAIRI